MKSNPTVEYFPLSKYNPSGVITEKLAGAADVNNVNTGNRLRALFETH